MQNEFQIEVSTDVLLNLNKSYIASLVDQARLNLYDGQIDALKLLVTAKKGQELFTQLEKTVRPYAEAETRIGKGEVYKKFGCDITERMTGVSYDFTNCDDSEWNSLTEQINTLTEKRKEREKFLKTITKPIFDENGVQINPPIHKGKLGLAVTIK
ncbi:hypothetical protein K7A41_09450 [Sphingobacterium sp. InxBP1]|uniref:hypothetical protein n=1 Tax=Sphingobacterium sp. InxBP1 TaxID=2870328 RepID=UPI00224371CB|nr:hypothetical protein [Sphingobacterium sp. InxBP1]MCW8311447.1 hypothetical protein [Sphingobacterium sp. InxBP1]